MSFIFVCYSVNKAIKGWNNISNVKVKEFRFLSEVTFSLLVTIVILQNYTSIRFPQINVCNVKLT